MAVNSGNGWIKFSIGTQVLKWNTGTANIFTSDPVDADGATDDTAILVLLLGALDALGLISDDTTGA